jgi:hypothetical protein
MRRHLIPAALALLLVPATVATVLRLMAEPPPSVLAFRRPTHRLAVAVEGAMRAELASVTWSTDMGFVGDFSIPIVNDPLSKVVEAKIPEDDSAFLGHPGNPPPGLLPPGSSLSPTLMTLDRMELEGKARGGRTVKATITGDRFGEGSVVDFHGDAEAARVLSGPIADRLAHPAHKPGSPEDRAALTAFFGPKPARTKGPATLDPAIQKAAGPPGVDPEDKPR